MFVYFQAPPKKQETVNKKQSTQKAEATNKTTNIKNNQNKENITVQKVSTKIITKVCVIKWLILYLG